MPHFLIGNTSVSILICSKLSNTLMIDAFEYFFLPMYFFVFVLSRTLPTDLRGMHMHNCELHSTITKETRYSMRGF